MFFTLYVERRDQNLSIRLKLLNCLYDHRLSLSISYLNIIVIITNLLEFIEKKDVRLSLFREFSVATFLSVEIEIF